MLKITYGFTHLARSATIATSVILGGLTGQEKQGKAGPVFKNGQAQVEASTLASHNQDAYVEAFYQDPFPYFEKTVVQEEIHRLTVAVDDANRKAFV